MEKIKEQFAQYFSNWNIRLPDDDVQARRSGTIGQAGWSIRYLFGREGDIEYLDFYASHRMTNDRHVRIHADGQEEDLETPQDFMVYPKDADETQRARIQEEYYAHNRAVYERLREKGFS